jgi:hypothetical protein
MKSKETLASLMKDGGTLSKFNRRVGDAVVAEVNNGDNSALYLCIAARSTKEDDRERVFCTIGSKGSVYEGVSMFLADKPSMIPIFESAVNCAKELIRLQQSAGECTTDNNSTNS